MTGLVKWINHSGGYGWIKRDGEGRDIFFSLEDCPQDEKPETGDLLEFDVIENAKGSKAERIRILKRGK